MTISKGDTLPAAQFLKMGDAGPEQIDLASLSDGQKIVIFGLPGAFTGTCSTIHLPGFMAARDALAAAGVDHVICVSVNDPFVMQAWDEQTGASTAGVTLLADAEGSFTKALGLDFTAPPVGLIGRSQRYSLVAENGVVTQLNVDENPGVCDLSAAQTVLDQLAS
jgi:peroxiredoxin